MPYTLLCTLMGLVLGWVPMFLHGPIPEKFNVLYIRGSIAVWGYYVARLLIGFMVGNTRWPRPWYVRGPMCGFIEVFPLTLISLAMPACGWPCMGWNLCTGSVIGTIIGGTAYLLTGKHRAD